MKISTLNIIEPTINTNLNPSSEIADDDEIYNPRQLLELTNTQGRYQKWFLIYSSLMCLCFSTIGFMLPYIFYAPTFICKTANGEAFSCKEEEACASPHGIFTTSDKFSLIDNYKLYCDNHHLAVWGKSFVFTLSSILTLFVVILSDYWGRLRIFYISWATVMIGSAIVNLAESYHFKIIGIGLLKTGCYSFFSGVYLYSSEITGMLNRGKIAEFF